MPSQHADWATMQSLPVDKAKRLAESEIKIEIAEEKDAYKFVRNQPSPCTSLPCLTPAQAEGLYLCFPESFWTRKEPLHLRPASDEIRVQRLAKRIEPSMSQPGFHWIKAVHIPSSTIIGAAGWADPSLPLHNPFRRDGIAFFGWQEKMGWSDADVEQLFAHVDDVAWNGNLAKYDEVRRNFFGDEKHWYLDSLFTWPGWQGRGVAKKLLAWAIDQADATSPPTPMYLETSPPGRAVYEHVGFVPHGEYEMHRRGPKAVEGKEKAEEKEVAKVDVEVVTNY